jgi:hypothetical protein
MRAGGVIGIPAGALLGLAIGIGTYKTEWTDVTLTVPVAAIVKIRQRHTRHGG